MNYTLEEARTKVKALQDRMYRLNSLENPAQMEIHKAQAGVMYVLSHMNIEDKIVLMEEIYQKLTGGK